MLRVLALEIGHKLTQYAMLSDDKVFPANILAAGTRFFPIFKKKGELSLLVKSIVRDQPRLMKDVTEVVLSFGPDVPLRISTLKDVIWRFDLSFSQIFPKARVSFLGREGRILNRNQALNQVDMVINNTWLTTARVLSNNVPSAVVIDARPSVTDISVIKGHAVLNKGVNDSERISLGELIPIGVTTTPLNAFVKQLPSNGVWLTVDLEAPALIGDVLRQSGDLPEELYPHWLSPDGKGTSIKACRERLTRFARLSGELQTPYQVSMLVSYIKELWYQEVIKGLIQVLSRKSVQPIERGIAIGPGSALAVNLFHRVGIFQAHDFAYPLNPTRKLASPSIFLAQYILEGEVQFSAQN